MKQLLVLLLLLCAANVSAQDVIVKKDGSTILSKVLEVGQTEIKYKRFDNLDGPTYTISKSELQAINYHNGAKDTFSEYVREDNRYLPNNQNDGVRKYNDNALLNLDANTYKKAKNLKTIGWIGGGVLLVTAGLFASSSGDDDWLTDEQGARPLTVVFGCAAVAWTTTFLLVANHKKKQIDNQLYSTSLYQSEIKLTNGSSLFAGVDLLSDRIQRSNTLGLGLRYSF